MQIKLLILSLILFGCGKNVQLKNNKLESLQQITEAGKEKLKKQGTYDSGQKVLIYQGRSYQVSKYSSHQALTFINSLPGNTQIPVKFIGEIISVEQGFDLESIERQ